ncbi:hypothetical protein [Cerasicoccus frondis]|uniref:hypothetical protein n=1 Tax=Cerasicoccus frondis TaxID=490090 RepID=UPI002852B4CB|nr:hypothetical protein [Cerasicoccus frondis]
MKLLVTLFTALLLASPWTFAQSARDKNPTLSLEVIYAFNPENPPPQFFYRNLEGEYSPLSVSFMARGNPNPVPRNSPLVLYREVNQDGQTIKSPALQIPLPINDDQAMLFFYLDQNSKVQFKLIEDAPNRHTGGSLRVVNLTQQEIACLIGKEQVRLGPFKDEVKNVMSGKQRFSFAFALLEPEPYKSPVKVLPMRSTDQRLLIIFSYQLRSVKGEGGRTSKVLVPDATRMYDKV